MWKNDVNNDDKNDDFIENDRRNANAVILIEAMIT